jgi:hypothetical protein
MKILFLPPLLFVFFLTSCTSTTQTPQPKPTNPTPQQPSPDGPQPNNPEPNNPTPNEPTPQEPTQPEQPTTTVILEPFGQNVSYTGYVVSRTVDNKRWSELKENVSGTITFEKVPHATSQIDTSYDVTSSGMYNVNGFWLEDATFSNNKYTVRIPLIKQIKAKTWRVSDDASSSRVALASFEIDPLGITLKINVSGYCEVYGDDYKFDSDITLNPETWGFGVSSLNGNEHNNTQFSCYFEVLPLELEGTVITNVDSEPLLY